MSGFRELVTMELRSLAHALASGRPAPVELEPSAWLGVLELLTQELSCDLDGAPTSLWELGLAAYDYASTPRWVAGRSTTTNPWCAA